MKKRILLVLVLLFVAIASFGCHKGKVRGKFQIPEDFDDTKEYNITFWSKNDSNKVQKQIYNDAIKRFNEYYPNIHVEIVPYTDYSAIHRDVMKNISTDTTPNVCITYPDFVATYLEGQNVVVSLDELINDAEYGLGGSKVKFDSVKKEEVITKFLDEGIIGGSYYSLPFVRSSEALYINKTYVEKLGYTVPDNPTWDFIWEVCAKVMEEDHPNGMIPFIYKSTDNMLIQICKQKNMPYSNENAEVLVFNDQVKEYLKELSGYSEQKLFNTFSIVGYPGNYLNRGNCVFAIDSTAGATWMGSEAPNIDIPENELVDFEIVVRPIPQYDTSNPKMISQGPSVCVFNKEDPNEVMASWLFAQFLLNTETQIAYSQTEGYVPVTTKARNDASYLEYLNYNDTHDYSTLTAKEKELYYYIKIDATKLVLENIDNTFITPVFNGSSSVRSLAGALIEQTVLLNKQATDSDIDDVFQRMRVLYKIDNIKKK